MRLASITLFALSLLIVCSWNQAPRAGPDPGNKVRAVDLYVVSDQAFTPGSQAAIRVAARGATSLATSRPLIGARVTVVLASDKGKQQRLFAGRSDARGGADVRFRVPDWPDGTYKMRVQVRSNAGQGKVERAVQLKRGGRVLLVTDKPIYQPRQAMQLRALVLGSHDLKPLGRELLRFQVLDPKGNKVFKRELRTDAHGIAATTFQLADEIRHGNYQIEAAPVRKDAAEPAQKTVVVKKYVLPKFKVEVKTDRPFYLPKQLVKGTVRADYFFGKAVARSKVTVEASTFDGVSFKKFSTLNGKTGDDGSWKFEIRLPDYFVGQPLLKGDALVKLAVKVTDTANHPERGTRSLPVAAAPIRVTAVPEAGRLIPGVENQVYVVATYPDGSPARTSIKVRRGKQRIATLSTDAAGLALLRLTPRKKQMRRGAARARRRFGRHVGYVYTGVMDLTLEARDARGNHATVSKSFSTDPERDVLLLRTDRAIYRSGDTLKASVLSSSGADTVFVDMIKDRQTVLTREVTVRGGKGVLSLPLGPDLFGTVELHAYKIRSDGEIQRDARVLYIQPANELKVAVAPDRRVYRPGEKAVIRFHVTDQRGEGQAAALGVIVVDEAVYALQELKPGLEKVFFTLERELARPKYEIEFGPDNSLPAMIQQRNLEQRRQRVAKVLLARARPAARPGLWRNPVAERMQQAQQDRWAIQSAIQRGLRSLKLARRTGRGRWVYRRDLVQRLVDRGYLTREQARDPFGVRYTVRGIQRIWPDLGADRLVPALELNILWSLHYQLQNEVRRRTRNFSRLGGVALGDHLRRAYREVTRRYPQMARDPTGVSYGWARVRRLPGFRIEELVAQEHQRRIGSIYYALSRYARKRLSQQDQRVLDRKRNVYRLPRGMVARLVREGLLNRRYARDIWGRPFQLRKRARPPKQFYYDRRLRLYAIYSKGPDGQAFTADDLRYPAPRHGNPHQLLARALGVKAGLPVALGRLANRGFRGRFAPRKRMAMPAAQAAPMGAMALDDAVGGTVAEREAEAPRDARSGADAPAAPRKRQVRVRSYFPETLLFEPALITDAQGNARLELSMADSITTWRMTASANSKQGALGATSKGLRVFQDFFVDLDLPVALTQNDEVSIPVVVYNYLKKPQRVRLELKQQGWFVLKGARVQELTLQPAEVAATYYRVRVKGLGRRTLQVRADGSNMSDAIRREIEVLPDGQEKNLVHNGRLKGTVEKKLYIPQDAVPGASKVLVRLYPGVFSQVIEGMESMLRLPGG